jgi:CheY-like chemotaxis protein
MGTRRVLIVGHDLQALDGLAGSLERYCLECETVVARDGAAALGKFCEQPFDLILTEYDLPDMTGLDLAHAIHRISPTTRIVLMVDPRSEKRSGVVPRSRALLGPEGPDSLDLRDYVRKPLGIEHLWKMVHSLN